MTCPGRCSWTYESRAADDDVRRLDVVCDQPNVLRCRECTRTILAVCGTARASQCSPCSVVYRGRVARVAGSGYRYSPDRAYFLTLTAPGAAPHRLPSGQRCPCTPVGGTDIGRWNGSSSVRWNRFLRDLRRLLGDLDYFRAVEVQRRGALHLHVILRLSALSRPPALSAIRRLAVHHGFGHSVDLQGLSAAAVDAAGGPAGYVAKYVAKAADQRCDVPWRGTRRQQGRVVHDRHGEVYGYAYPNGDLEDRSRRVVFSMKPTYRTWSASRGYGESMAAVRAAQSHWQAVMASLDPGLPYVPEIAVLAPQRPDLAALPPG